MSRTLTTIWMLGTSKNTAKPNRRNSITLECEIHGPLKDNGKINTAVKRLRKKAIKLGYPSLYSISEIELDIWETGYCRKCKKEHKYRKTYSMFQKPPCPDCSSELLTDRYRCPKCGKNAYVISTVYLTEAVAYKFKCVTCGHVDSDVCD